MQEKRISFMVILAIIIITTFNYAQVSLTIPSANVTINADNSGTLNIDMTNGSFCSYCEVSSAGGTTKAFCDALSTV